jgi:hypothetical protein
MPQATTIKTNSSAGELSPQLRGRLDLSKYANGNELQENFVSRVHGPAVRRPGTYFVAEVKTSTALTRVVPFNYSTTQAYAIEFGNLYVRFYRNHARVETSPGVAYELATPYTTAELRALKFCQSADVLYIFHPSHPPQKLNRFSDTSWSLTGFSSTSDGPYMAAPTGATTLTPSGTAGAITVTASALGDINGGAGFQLTDVGRLIRMLQTATWGYMVITSIVDGLHVNATVLGNPLAGVAAAGGGQWRLGSWSGTTGYPSCGAFYQNRLFCAGSTAQPQTLWGSKSSDFETFQETREDGTVLDSSAINLTISDDQVNAVKWMSAGKVLSIGTLGGEHTLQAGSTTEALKPTNAKISRESTHGSAANVNARRVDRAVLFVQRAGRKLREQIYDYASDGFQASDLTLLSEHVTGGNVAGGVLELDYQEEPASVAWMVRADGQLVGCTYDRLQQVSGFHRHKLGGSYYTGQAVVESVAVIPNPAGTADELWLVVKRTIGGVVKRYVEYLSAMFDENIDGQEGAYFVDGGLSSSLTTRAGTLTPGVGALTAGTAGVVFVLSGGTFSSGDVGTHIRVGTGKALVTAFTDSTHVVATIVYPFASLEPQATGAWSITTPGLTFSGLSHLEGERVAVVADGSYRGTFTVSGGAVTIASPAASKVHVGLHASAKLRPMRVEAGAAAGTSQGQMKRIDELIVRFDASSGARYGKNDSASNLHDFPWRAATDAIGKAPPLITGDVLIKPFQGPDRDGTITIVCDAPLPCTVVAVIFRLVTSA